MFKLEDCIIDNECENSRQDYTTVVTNQAHWNWNFFFFFFQIVTFEEVVHDINVSCSTYQSSPNSNWTENHKRAAEQKFRIHKHEYKVNRLKYWENPNSFHFDVLETWSWKKSTKSIAPIHDDKKFFDFSVIFTIREFFGKSVISPVCKASDDTILKEINKKKIDDLGKHFGKYSFQVLPG